MLRGSAIWQLLARSETLRSIKRTLFGTTARPGRRRIPTALGVQGLLDTMNRHGIDYAVLRWFDQLPDVDEGEDLDVLVSDEHALLVDQLLTRSTEEGTTPCDVYSVRGRAGFKWKNTAYYPPHLAAGLLDRSVQHPSGARVLCPEDHFHTLAFHALYHKGYASGLPVSATEGPRSDNPEHDYLQTLSGLAAELDLDVVITMEDLDRFLQQAGWRPALDTLAKWSPNNPWVEQLHESLIGDDPAPEGLAVLIVRERAADPGSLDQIARLAREHGLVQIALETLTSDARERASRSLRGGDWGQGPYPTSGGEPAAVLIVVDPSPVPPSPEQLAAHPGLDNGRLPVFKEAVRTWWNEQQSPADRCNILHTSDSAAHSRHYLEVIFPDRADRLVQLAAIG
jgi:hypothetical protein